MRAQATRFLWIVIVFLVAGASYGAAPEFFHGKIRMQDRNEGYALLYELASSESDVDDLFIIKSANTNVTALIKEIADNAGKLRDQLDAFAEKDRHLRLKETHLPLIEQRTRASIETATRNELLFSAGASFETRLLFTQAQATQYGCHLAKLLRDTEDSTERKAYLDTVVKKWDDLYQRVMKLLLPKE